MGAKTITVGSVPFEPSPQERSLYLSNVRTALRDSLARVSGWGRYVIISRHLEQIDSDLESDPGPRKSVISSRHVKQMVLAAIKLYVISFPISTHFKSVVQ